MPNYRTMRRVREWEWPPSKPFNKDGTRKKPWVVTLWEDGSYSCTCPIWCKQPENGQRSCKHIGRVLQAVVTTVAQSAPQSTARVVRPVLVPTEASARRRVILED